jgi:hypothetical protein
MKEPHRLERFCLHGIGYHVLCEFKRQHGYVVRQGRRTHAAGLFTSAALGSYLCDILFIVGALAVAWQVVIGVFQPQLKTIIF